MTFETYLNSHTDVYPSGIPDDLKELIFDWFFDWEVCDDEFFGRYFARVLNRDYMRYTELLRTEPGYAHYDWLVTSYNEARDWGTDNGTAMGSKTGNSNSETTTTGKNDGTSTTTGSSTSSTTTTEDGGTYKEKTTTNGNKTDAAQDKYTISTGSETPLAGSTTVTKTAQVDKNNPYTVTYASAVAGEIPALDWSSSSAQAQNESTATVTPDGKANSSESRTEEHGGNRQDYTDESTTEFTGSRSSTAASNGSNSDNVITSSTSEGSSKTTGNSGETTTNKSSNNSDHYHMDTGRNGAPADLLLQAKSYIMGTTAWEWLKHRLNSCFIGVFEW